MKQITKKLLKIYAKETEAKKAGSEIKLLIEAIINENVKVRECENESTLDQSNNKDDIFEKDLVKSKRLAQDLKVDAERVCLE